MPFDNEMRGVLFRNKKKEEGDNKPNATGRIQINGVVYWLSAWTAEKDGDRYQQLRAERAEDRYQVTSNAPPEAADTAPIDAPPVHEPPDYDDIPF